MGSRGGYLNGRWEIKEYTHTEAGKIGEVKILRITDSRKSAKLPIISNRSTAYVGTNSQGQVCQLRVFKNQKPVMDVDFGHAHHHGLDRDDFHVHDYVNGNRSVVSRELTTAEWARWRYVIEEILRRRR